MFRGPVTAYLTTRMRDRDRDRDRDAVPDLVQDTFCDALAELPTAPLNVRGWFIILAAPACTRHDWRRRYTKAALTVRDETVRAEAAPSDLPAVPTWPGRLTFAHALARLTPDQRHAVQLRFLDGYLRDAAAALMGRSIEAVRCLERRGLYNLRHGLHPTDR